MHTAVWKVGGSLFDLPDLAPRLMRLLSSATNQRTLLVPGGGVAADLVRNWQQHTGISDESAHWLALRAMDFNAHLLSAALPNSDVVDAASEAMQSWIHGRQPVLLAGAFAVHEERERF